MKKHSLMAPVLAAVLLAGLLAAGFGEAQSKSAAALAGAWKGGVVGTSGWLADMKGLAFMYVFNADGTMTESSNFDAFPPGPPAYGVWRKVGERQYEARYEVFLTKAVAVMDEIAKGNGWVPNGYGVLTQKITLAADGDSFESTLKFELFDQQGKPMEGGGTATAQGKRMKFQ